MRLIRRAIPSLIALAGCIAPVASASAAPVSQEGAHVVEQGETLNGIANRAGVTPGAIASANNLQPPYVVKVGQSLTIPRAAQDTAPAAGAAPQGSPRTYTVTSGETLNGIANRTGVSADDLARANGIEAPYVVRIGQTLTIPGRSGEVRTASRTLAPRAEQTTPADLSETHVVKSGETLGGIANRTGVPRVLIAEANGLQPPYIVKVGQTLHIPRTRHYTVAKGDSGFSIALNFGIAWNDIAVASGVDPNAAVVPGQKLVIPSVLAQKPAASITAAPASSPPLPSGAANSSRFLWPVKGPIERGFATGTNYHDGLDIKAAKGTMVRAAASGTVRFAGMEKEQFGNLVVIDHGDGWFTAYAFLSRITVKKGAKVAKGERIGLVGDTGQAVGDELHFEIRQNGKPVNPVDELPKAP